MKYSDWQSGAISPQFSGYYERRLKKHNAPLDDGYYYINSEAWSCGSSLNFAHSDLQKSNGNSWQWRGRID